MRQAPVLLALLLLALAAPRASAVQDDAATGAPRPLPCPQAAVLPPTASEQDIRITCEIPGPFRLAVQDAERNGASLRFLDIAGWLSTDALKEKQAFADAPGEPLGWLVVPTGAGYAVPYFTRLQDGSLAAFAEARMGPKGVTRASALSPPRPATAEETRWLAARALALAAPGLRCTKAVNAIVVPAGPGANADILVHVNAAWSAEAAPLGGFEQFRISHDGTRILSREAHTRACLNLAASEAAKAGALAVTDLRNTTPNAVHVLLSLQYARPLHVLTLRNGRLWTVDKGRIRVAAPAGTDGERLAQWRERMLSRPVDDPNRIEETLP